MGNIVIVDYGLGNIDSVYRAVQECGGTPIISDDPAAAATADKLILPGVGSFSTAMAAIRKKGWDKALKHEVIDNKIPLLGICLGMQILASYGEEGGGAKGLDLIPGKVVRLMAEQTTTRIPHVGWNEVLQKRKIPLFYDISDKKDFYFVHSFHFRPEDPDHIAALTPYAGSFVSVVERNNIVGTQFHPEKSLGTGFSLIRNFLRHY